MGLTVISEAVENIEKKRHSFTVTEREFVLQFAFRTNDMAATNDLIDEIAMSEEGTDQIMEKYARLYDMKPVWVQRIESLLVSIELYRIQEEKALRQLAVALGNFGVKVTEEEVRRADAEEIKVKIEERRQEQQEEEQREKEKREEEQERRPPFFSDNSRGKAI